MTVVKLMTFKVSHADHNHWKHHLDTASRKRSWHAHKRLLHRVSMQSKGKRKKNMPYDLGLWYTLLARSREWSRSRYSQVGVGVGIAKTFVEPAALSATARNADQLGTLSN